MNDYLNESRKRLEAIEKEQKREKFLRWASSTVKCLRKLDETELHTLKFYYENVESWKKVIDSTVSIAINNIGSETNYNNDLETRRKQSDIAFKNLQDYVRTLEEKYNLTEEEKINPSEPLKR